MAAAKSPGFEYPTYLSSACKYLDTEKCMEDGRSQQAQECGILIFWGEMLNT